MVLAVDDYFFLLIQYTENQISWLIISKLDLLVVFQSLKNFGKDFKQISSLAYDATFGRNRPFVFSITLTDQKTFLTGLEPLLLNIRQEGKKAA